MKFFFPHNELTLLERVANGDETAFRQLYDLHRDQVFYFGLKLLKSQSAAEDVLQEVYSKIWINRKTLGEVVNFSKYLNTLTLNYIYNLLRKKAYEESFFRENLFRIDTRHEEAFNHVDLHELERLIERAVKQLPPQQKKVFELSRVQGLKHEEIANQLHISRETVKKHIMEALRNVKSYLAASGEIVVRGWIALFFYNNIF